MRKYIIASAALLASLITLAQQADQPIRIQSLDMQVHAGLFAATTRLEIRLFNPNNKILDGEYNFSLAEKQVVTCFALDLNDHFREGVITEKQKARVAYENTIRRRVDPGILEQTGGNTYRVRVYPMPANGTRTIRITIAGALPLRDNALHYFFPLESKTTIDHFNLHIEATSAGLTPLAGQGLLAKSVFEKASAANYSTSYSAEHTTLEQPVAFRIPLGSGPYYCETLSGNDRLFALHQQPAVPAEPPLSFHSATIFWDVSGSSAKRDIRKEIDFLELLLASKKIEQVTVVTFSYTIHESKAFYGRSISHALRSYLESQIADGGTRLGGLQPEKFEADLYLLFSDGQHNFRTAEPKAFNHPLYCVGSSKETDHASLEQLAEKSGGRYINLSVQTTAAALTQLEYPAARLWLMEANGQPVNTSTGFPFTFVNWLSIGGTLPSAATSIDLRFARNGRIVHTENTAAISSQTCDSNEVQQFLLLQEYERIRNHEPNAMPAFAKARKIVTPHTSFIVLDSLQDYITYGIEPPPDLLEEYNKLIYVIRDKEDQRKLNEANALVNNLRKAITLYNERITWWGKSETPIAIEAAERKGPLTEAPLLANASTNNASQLRSLKPGEVGLSEVVVIGYGTQRRANMTGSVSIISSSSLSNASNFSQALEGRVAGLSIVHSNGAPGAAVDIRLRGARTLDPGQQPLYIVDGVPTDAEVANTISTQDISNVEILKDAEAGAIYGSRAANGVIIINTRRIALATPQPPVPPAKKFKPFIDPGYLDALKNSPADQVYENYLLLKDSIGDRATLYFEVADLLFRRNDTLRALRVLSNLAEINSENHQLLRALAYRLETWHNYEDAIAVYQKVLAIKEEEPQSWRDLALAYERNGNHQQAVNWLYKAMTKNWEFYEDRYRGLKSLLLNEMNAIIALHRKELDLSAINEEIIRPLPVDLRIVIDWNKDETDIDLHVVEPGGEECFYGHRITALDGRLSEDFTQGYGPEEYQIKTAKKGNYSIRIDYFGDRYQKEQVPSFIKLTIYRNFGKPNQTVTTQALLLDKQEGMIEIGKIKIE